MTYTMMFIHYNRLSRLMRLTWRLLRQSEVCTVKLARNHDK